MRLLGTLLLLPLSGCGLLGYGDASTCTGSDCNGLEVSSTVINERSAFAIAPRLSVDVTVSGGYPPLSVRLAPATSDGNCQAAFADDQWQAIDGAQARYAYLVAPSDGEKKLCAWAKDSRDNITIIVPAVGRDEVQTDSIEFRSDAPPEVVSFSVVNASTGLRTHAEGEALRVEWEVRSAIELADAPIDIDYTLDGPDDPEWLPLAAGIGDPSGTGTMTTLVAPTDQPFRLRLRARDSAGNRSVSALSNVQNVDRWGVYLGSREQDVAGTSAGTALRHSFNSTSHFAIDPHSGDAYASDHGKGIVRLDAATGLTELFIREGNLLLPDDDVLPPDAAIPRFATLKFGSDGKLYVGPGAYGLSRSESGVIYQIDPETRHCRRFIGGGDVIDDSATAENAFVLPWVFDLDEDSSLYYFTSCTPGQSPEGQRLMKATQGPDGTVDSIAAVAGDCTSGTPGDGPSPALSTPLGINSSLISSIAVWGRGSRIYYVGYLEPTWKIIDGQHYAASVDLDLGETLAYDPSTETLIGTGNQLVRYAPNLSGARGDEAVEEIVSATGSGRCTDDGIPAAQACVPPTLSIAVDPNGRVYFADGALLNSSREYRVRFIDDDGLVQTYFGAKSFHGEGLHRRSVRGDIRGIYYKQTSEANQTAFPPGLYFVDRSALVFAHIDEDTQRSSVLWGNQSGTNLEFSPGETISPELGIGVAYAGGNLTALAFSDGLPYLRYGPRRSFSNLVTVNPERQVVVLQDGTQPWDSISETRPAADASLWPYGGANNLAVKAQTVFLSGAYESYDNVADMKKFDFSDGSIRQLIGAAPNGFTSDIATPGEPQNASLSDTCFRNFGGCYLYYRADQDRLYFSEDNRVRYLTSPDTPDSSTLGTVFQGSRDVRNFTISNDGSMLFYLSGRRLYCHDLGGAPAFCDDTNLGPPTLIGEIRDGANQLTWKDDTTLLISTGHGEVLEFSAQ